MKGKGAVIQEFLRERGGQVSETDLKRTPNASSDGQYNLQRHITQQWSRYENIPAEH